MLSWGRAWHQEDVAGGLAMAVGKQAEAEQDVRVLQHQVSLTFGDCRVTVPCRAWQLKPTQAASLGLGSGYTWFRVAHGDYYHEGPHRFCQRPLEAQLRVRLRRPGPSLNDSTAWTRQLCYCTNGGASGHDVSIPIGHACTK